MNSRGSLQRKCVKGHPKAASRCSGRCIRYYPRLELPRSPTGTRRFEALGGYPTRSQAEAALAAALARRAHGFALDPAKLTLNQYLDRWLVHVRISLRARTVARYAALLRDHVRPSLGARPLKQLTPLEVQAVYDRLTVGGRRDGKPGGLAPQHILAVHRCLHRALAQALTWRLVAANVATDATHRRCPGQRWRRWRPSRSPCCWTPPATPPHRGLALGRCSRRRPAPATASCAASNGPISSWTPASSGSARRSPSSTQPSFPRPPTPGAGARNSRSGRSSPLPAARCSPCRRSPSRRSASTAASRPACASPAGSPRR